MKNKIYVVDKIYVVEGYVDYYGDIDTWIKELFEDEKQAKACCAWLNATNTQDNIEYFWYETNGFCTEDYISKLKTLRGEE